VSRCVLLRAGLLLGVVLAGALLALPNVRWPLWGWLRGESFYRGWPTSYYRDLVKRGVTLEPSDTGELVATAPAPSLPLEGRPEVTPVYRGLGLAPRRSRVLFDPADADRAAPVLAELLRDGDPDVVANTSVVIAYLGPPARRSAPALAAVLEGSDDEALRLPLAWALGRVDPQSDEAARALAGMVRGPDKSRAVTAASLLGTIGPGAEAAVPALAEAVKDSDFNLAVHAANALKRIDPKAAAEAGVP
jgi:HEAT repeat protein